MDAQRTNKMDNTSPLRYPGGKTRARKVLAQIVQDHFAMGQVEDIVSPFFGGGSFEFYLQSIYRLPIRASDKFGPLFSFWNACANDQPALCAALRSETDVSKEQFAHYRDTIMHEEDGLQQAMKYFVINRCSFSGATLSGGFSGEAAKKRFTASSIDRVQQLDLTHFTMDNMDFEEFLAGHAHDKSFIFLDPPYYLGEKSHLYGKNGDMHDEFDHDRLFAIVTAQPRWLMTYNDCEYIRELYKDFTILEVDWAYGMNASKKSSEIVVLSSPY